MCKEGPSLGPTALLPAEQNTTVPDGFVPQSAFTCFSFVVGKFQHHSIEATFSC